MAGDFYDPWLCAHRPEVGEMVQFVGFGHPHHDSMLARVLAVDKQRDRVLLALGDGRRRWDYVSQVRPHVEKPRRRRVKDNPKKRGRKRREEG
ncbi:MAG: hypothetical protein M3Y56_02535 [Armatimonadota bacterium]|nr:hypothetical protein [Armatimonadota bacterium]